MQRRATSRNCPDDRIATVCGRYYAMDRDSRWERTDRAFRAICLGEGVEALDPVAAVEASYEQGVTDEFVEPVVVTGRPSLGPQDTAIFFNFRPDRARQLSQRLLEAGIDLTTMTRYREDFPFPVAFAEQQVPNTLAEVLAASGLRQLHVAETEKYAHVTYFFNGGEEREWEGETRILVPSPRDVPSYDLKPEMSADEVARRFCDEIGHGYAFAVVNFANPDMVGHTGSIPAVVAAVEAADRALGQVVDCVARGRRGVFGDRRPRERRGDARARRRQPAHGAHDESGAARRHERAVSSSVSGVGSPISHPPSWGCSSGRFPLT